MKGFTAGDKILDGLYEIKNSAEGGAAFVYKARHTKWNIDMAIKIPNEEMQTEQSKKEFKRECTIWMDLGIHPNIAFCYYVREIDGQLAAFSEWEDGGTLNDAVENGILYKQKKTDTQKNILHISIQIMRGLAYAHSKNVAHKDLKPENILVTGGDIRINDFGLANSLIDALTRKFASPEQLNNRRYNKNDPVGTSSDIYSWALTVMTMYIGGSDKWDYGIEAVKRARDLLGSKQNKASVPEEMKNLLCECLKEEPSERPSADQLLTRLTDIYKQIIGEEYPYLTEQNAMGSAGLMNNRALSYIDMGEHEKAMEYWDRALEITPNHTESLYNKEINKDEIRFEELEKLLRRNGADPKKYKEIFDEISRAVGSVESVSYVSVNGQIEHMSFSDDGKLLFFRYADDGKIYALNIKTEKITACKKEVHLQDAEYDPQTQTTDLEYGIGNRILMLSETEAYFETRVSLGDRIDGKTHLFHTYEDIRVPFCFSPDGKFFAAYYVLLKGERTYEYAIKIFPVPEPYCCKYMLSKVSGLNDTLENNKRLVELLKNAETELERGNYQKTAELLLEIEEVPEFENQWERFYKLKREAAKGCIISKPHIRNSISIERSSTILYCAFSPDCDRLALVLFDGTVEICGSDASPITTIVPDKNYLVDFTDISSDISSWFSNDGKKLTVCCWRLGFDEEKDEEKYLIYDLQKGVFDGFFEKNNKAVKSLGDRPSLPSCPEGLTIQDEKSAHCFSKDGFMVVGFDTPIPDPSYLATEAPWADHSAVLYYLDYDLKIKQDDTNIKVNTKKGVGSMHYYTGTWNGRSVKFNRVWSGHRFTDEECGKLCNGEEIKISAISAKNGNKPFTCKGKLEEQTYNGHTFIGFKKTGSANDNDTEQASVNNEDALPETNTYDGVAGGFPGDDDEDLYYIHDPVIKRQLDEKDGLKRQDKVTALSQTVIRLKEMRDELSNEIIGQDHAVDAFISGMFRAEVKDDPQKRRGVKAIFTFAGPPGVGKTMLAEKAAEKLNLPYKRFDMTEYTDEKGTSGLIGFEYTWKDSKAGALTSFVRENPDAVLLFDEIEKAHPNVLRLFYQMLDDGFLTDKYYETKSAGKGEAIDEFTDAAEPKVSFKNTIVIFTSNVGRSIYEDENFVNGSEISEQTMLNALKTEKDPERRNVIFLPSALVSRISTGTTIMFNNLTPDALIKITEMVCKKSAKRIKNNYGLSINTNKELYVSLLFSIGGQTDARMLTSKADGFLSDEIFKIMKTDPLILGGNDKGVDYLNFEVELPKKGENDEILGLFEPTEKLTVLAYVKNISEDELADNDEFNILTTYNAEEAAALANTNNFDLILLYITREDDISNNTSIASPAARVWKSSKELFDRLHKSQPDTPIYILESPYEPLPEEVRRGYIRNGARAVLTYDENFFEKNLADIADTVHMQKSAAVISKGHRKLEFDTTFNKPEIVKDENGNSKKVINIKLRNFELTRAPLADDVKMLLKDIDVPKDRFDDVVGAKRAKEALEGYKKYFENPREYTANGLKPPKGVLLYGKPGTGKTMLARAMAGECGVTFIPAVAADFRYPDDINKLFSTARKYAPAIIFIDEVDTIGKERTGNGSAAEIILNTLLAEMDGFRTDPKRPVFVLAATNYGIPDDTYGLIGTLDAAFCRRFDQCIRVSYPEKEERTTLVTRFLDKLGEKKHKLGEKDIETFADRTGGTSPAFINRVLETALQLAHKDERLTLGHMLTALENTMYGEKKKAPNSEALRETACHEAGHTLINYLCGYIPSYLTIEARGEFGGYMAYSEEEFRKPHKNRTDFLNDIRCALGGRAAEIVYYGKELGVNVGAYDDLRQATMLARNMFTCFGMDDDFGLVSAAGISANTEKLRECVNNILKHELENAIEAIKANKSKMDMLIDALMKNGRLVGYELKEILEDKPSAKTKASRTAKAKATSTAKSQTPSDSTVTKRPKKGK